MEHACFRVSPLARVGSDANPSEVEGRLHLGADCTWGGQTALGGHTSSSHRVSDVAPLYNLLTARLLRRVEGIRRRSRLEIRPHRPKPRARPLAEATSVRG